MREKSSLSDNSNLNITWRTCLKIAITALIVFLIVRYWGSVEGFFSLLLGGMVAIIAGLVISYIVNIPLRFFERKLPGPRGDGTRNRGLATALSFVCAIGVVLFVGILVIPNLVEAIMKLAQSAPGVIDSIAHNKFIASFIPPALLAQIVSIDWEQVVNDIAAWLQSGVVSSLPQIMSLAGQIGACFMGVVLSFWFLGEKDKLSRGVHTLVRTYISKRADQNFSRAIAVADKCFRGYFNGAAMEALIFGSIVTVVSAIAGIQEPLMLGALVGVMSL
ncbi:MAG: AI-2E family transporter, partial [Eggerthellaceae bacterium]|nr:AI-2E family transporter [Eggerthellaceae bacterium]